MAPCPEPLTAIRVSEAALTVVAVAKAPAGARVPALTSAIPTKGATKRPCGVLGSRRLLLATREAEPVVAVKVIGRRTFLAPLQTVGPLVVAAFPGVQDTEPRVPARRVTLGVFAITWAPLGDGAVLAVLILPWRKVRPP